MGGAPTGTAALAVRRVLAFAVDWLLIAAWGGVLFCGALLATAGSALPRPSGPWTGQAIGLVAMTLPVTLYFALCESSRRGASVGKRCLGLVVRDGRGGALGFGRSLLRTAAKFVPWELGHTVAHQAIHARDTEFPAWLWGPVALAFAGPAWYVLAMFTRGQTPYDRWAGAWVRMG